MDIFCGKCSEPYDAYGAANGDMENWEWALFKKGAGCPSCEGVTPDELSEEEAKEEHIKSVIFGGWESPHDFVLVNNPDAKVPLWEKPADTVVRKCHCCGDKACVKEKPDGETYWAGISATTAMNQPHSILEWEEALDLPEEFTLDGRFYCPPCYESIMEGTD